MNDQQRGTTSEGSSGGAYHVIAEAVAGPGKADRLRELLVPFAASSAREPGCLEYRLMEVRDEPGRFMTVERWADRAAADAHMATPAIAALVGELQGVLAAPFTQVFLEDPRPA